jgi:hypothetical protein
MRIAFYSVVLALLLTVLWWARGEHDFEHAATRVALSYETRDACPLSDDYSKNEDVGLLSICSTFGLQAYEAARRYPKIAGNIFATYGGLAELREIIEEYGHRVIPVIQYFRERNSREFRFRAWLRGDVELTPDQHGIIAIFEIKRRGHKLLSEFTFADGAARVHSQRAANFVAELFTGGITDLEVAILRGEKPTWKQVGFAVLDVTIVLGGASVVVNSLKAAKVAGRGIALARVGAAVRTVVTVGKATGKAALVAAPVAFAYMALNHPGMLASGAGWIAEHWLGAEWRWVGVLVLALVVATCIMSVLELVYKFLRLLLAPVIFPYRLGLRFVRLYRRRHPKQA